MRLLIAAFMLLCVAVALPVQAEDPKSRRHCIKLIAYAAAESSSIRTEFANPDLAIPAHTYRHSSRVQHCLFMSKENELLYVAFAGDKAFGFRLSVDSTFVIPVPFDAVLENGEAEATSKERK